MNAQEQLSKARAEISAFWNGFYSEMNNALTRFNDRANKRFIDLLYENRGSDKKKSIIYTKTK